MPFRPPDDTEKWCEIHRTSGHDLEEYKTFMDRKKMPPPAVSVAQEPQQGEHHWANPPDDDEPMGEINVIFKGSMTMSYPVPRNRERSLHTCAQDVQITRMATI
jgi:hypothetical protein